MNFPSNPTTRFWSTINDYNDPITYLTNLRNIDLYNKTYLAEIKKSEQCNIKQQYTITIINRYSLFDNATHDYLRLHNVNINGFHLLAFVDNKYILTRYEESLKAYPNVTDNDALTWACQFGYLAMARILTKRGANIHADYDYAVRCASQNGHIDVVRFLVKLGANIHARNGYAIRYSSENGHIDVARFLVKSGANIHACDDYAVIWASKYGHIDIVRLLVKSGANIHANDGYAVRWASLNGHIDVVRFLLDNGANINHVKQKMRQQLELFLID